MKTDSDVRDECVAALERGQRYSLSIEGGSLVAEKHGDGFVVTNPGGLHFGASGPSEAAALVIRQRAAKNYAPRVQRASVPT